MRFKPEPLQTGLRWLPALFFATLIFLFSATPGKQVAQSFDQLNSKAAQVVTPAASQQPQAAQRLLPETIDWLKVGHVIGYFCLGLSVLWGSAACSGRGVLTAQVICSLYAVSDELHQNFTPGRSASGSDVLLDSAAACGGILVLLALLKARQRFKSRPAGSSPARDNTGCFPSTPGESRQPPGAAR